MKLTDIQILQELADHLYSYLPGKAHPFADQNISFLGAASEVGLEKFWQGGSKKPAIVKLLELTLKHKRDKFCPLILSIVERSMMYTNRATPVTKEEIKRLNEIILKLEFKIPELWKSDLLNSLPSSEKEEQKEISKIDLSVFKGQLIEITSLEPHQRGFAFEKFLNSLFFETGLTSRPSFRIVGEQIDGSFELDSHTYLLEAKWQTNPVAEDDLLIFHGKISGKATWSRGLFICYNRFSQDGLTAFTKGKSTNMIGMTSQDLFFILDGRKSLADAIRAKSRWAAETGEFYKSIYEIDDLY